jgi:hypothetical protein
MGVAHERKTGMRMGMAAALTALVLVTGCTTGPGGYKQPIGGLLGGAAGGLLGARFGGGPGQIAAAATGAVLGAYLGQEAGASMDRADDLASRPQLPPQVVQGPIYAPPAPPPPPPPVIVYEQPPSWAWRHRRGPPQGHWGPPSDCRRIWNEWGDSRVICRPAYGGW